MIGAGACVVIVISVVATVMFVNRTPAPKVVAFAPAVPVPVAVEPKAAAPLTPAPSPVVIAPVTIKIPLPVAPPVETPPAPRPVADNTPAPAPAAASAAPVTTAPAPAAEAPATVAKEPVPEGSLADRINDYVDKLRVTGIRTSESGSKVLMNDKVYRANDVVNRALGLRLVKIAADSLTFADASGATYVKNF